MVPTIRTSVLAHSPIQRDVISRGIFTSAKGLGCKLMRCIREHNKDSKPIKRKYDDSPQLVVSTSIPGNI